MNLFDHCSDDYARFRPGYPEEFYDLLTARCGLQPSSLILDIGAGTAKGSAPLADLGFRVVAVEPSQPMRREGRRSHPSISYVGSTAEHTALRTETFDLVLAAQAFHWFDPVTALPEIHRVLKAGGSFAAFWNNRDITASNVADFERLIKVFNPDYVCAYRKRNWLPVLVSTRHFRFIESKKLSYVRTMTADAWIGYARSLSYVACLAGDILPLFEDALRNTMTHWSSFDLPSTAELWLCRKENRHRR